MKTKTELEYAIWQAQGRDIEDHEGATDYYRCLGTGEVWVRSGAGMHIAFVVRD